jgi:hypothetical protein
VGTACDCGGHLKAVGAWLVCSGPCHHWFNPHTDDERDSDFRDMRPGA